MPSMTNLNSALVMPTFGEDEKVIRIKEFSEFLDMYNLSYSLNDIYLQVGDVSQVQGWKFHISVISCHLFPLIQSLFPYLIKENIPFRIVVDSNIYGQILSGLYGYERLGKVICIYPDQNIDLEHLAIKLIDLTQGFHGPEIPTDIQLGGALFVSYGGHTPKRMTDINGIFTDFIFNSSGLLVKDVPPIPFLLPAGIEWPFKKIASPIPPKLPTLLNKHYIAHKKIKSDAKGDVVKGISIKKILDIQWCLIKQGKKFSFFDDEGRDIRDRLLWQKEIYEDLAGLINIPKVLDFFYYREDAYFVCEFIEGRSLDAYIGELHTGGSWNTFTLESKLKTLGYLIDLLESVRVLHKKGYVHRDITPGNFQITKDGKLYLIDPELTYSIIKNYPAPPFKLGTFGYMSPEQYENRKPTVYEDIYAIGATMVLLFTGLHTFKMKPELHEELHENIHFFIQDSEISHLILDCLQPLSGSRPSLDLIIEKVKNYKHQIIKGDQNKPIIKKAPFSKKDTSVIIKLALEGLANKELSSTRNIWHTTSTAKTSLVQNENLQKRIYPGLLDGVSGPLYVIAVAKNKGYESKNCSLVYWDNINFIKEQFLDNISSVASNFAEGAAGMAIALYEGIKAGLIPEQNALANDIEKLLNTTSLNPGLYYGLSGIGIAILKCKSQLTETFSKSKISEIIEFFKKTQLSDGSWITDITGLTKKEKLIGIGKGVSGISYFLIEYYRVYHDESIVPVIHKSLNWIIKQSSVKEKTRTWPFSTKQKVIDISLSDGLVGVISLFIKAYQVFHDDQYKTISQQAISYFDMFQVDFRAGINDGMAGRGEMYLDAFEAFGQEEYFIQAQWNSEVLKRAYIYNEDSIFWLINSTIIPEAGIFNGCSGIIHFLLRMENSGIDNLITF
ncbi:MAG: protein kinase [Chitinophagaceae bacterium]|nr:protein kinase [Chitinophagaceae bacterium]